MGEGRIARGGQERLRCFKAELVLVAHAASADLIDKLKAFAGGSSTAESIYSLLTDEARSLSIAIRRARRPSKGRGASARGPNRGPEALVESDGVPYRLSQAETRLDVLRRMQRAALEDAVEEEKRRREPSAVVRKETADTCEEQQAFVWPKTSGEKIDKP